MTQEERRNIRAMALLEVEDAKAELAILRVKAGQWMAAHERASKMLAAAMRNPATQLIDPGNKTGRWDFEQAIPSFGDAMKVEAILALDDELNAAFVRLKRAEECKKDLGFA
jgi:hypothetical protein